MTELNKFTTIDFIILIGSIILIGFILYMIVINKPDIIEKNVMKASRQTQFNPTYFEIYDKSTKTICDRIIIVQPFSWIIWAKAGFVYVVNDTNYTCPTGTTPGIRIPTEVDTSKSIYTFDSVCINIVLDSILNGYRDVIPVKVPYDIEKLQQQPNKFTILDALNYLFTKYLTMLPDSVRNKNKVPMNILDETITKSFEIEKIKRNRTPRSTIENMSIFSLNRKQQLRLEDILETNKRLKLEKLTSELQ